MLSQTMKMTVEPIKMNIPVLRSSRFFDSFAMEITRFDITPLKYIV